MRTIVKLRYRLFQRSNGIFLIEDRVTGKQASLQTRDKVAAQRIFGAKNESHQQPAINLQIARAYLTSGAPRSQYTCVTKVARTLELIRQVMERGEQVLVGSAFQDGLDALSASVPCAS